MSMRHVARVLATFAGLALISSASVAAAASHTPAPAAAALDSFPNAPDVILWPPHPCIENQVTLYVRGYVATPCDSFLTAYRTGDREIVVRTLAHADFRCAVAPSEFFAVPISFGQLPAGPTTIVIRRNMLSRSGGTLDSTVTTTEVSFSVADACPDPPLPFPAADLPFVDSVVTVPSPACPELPVTVRFRGHFNDGCGRLVSAGLAGSIQLVLAPHPGPARPCPLVIAPWNASVSIGHVIPGSHSVLVHETLQGTNAFWPPVPDADYYGLFDFTVSGHCDSIPAALPPYVNFLRIGPAEGDSTGVICPDSPMRVSIGGVFPDVCHRINRIDVAYPIADGPGAFLPMVQVWVQSCPESINCVLTPTPWDTTVVLGGLPPGAYSQLVLFAYSDCTRPFPADTVYTTHVPFLVARGESCGVAPPSGCLIASWDPGFGGCNAFLDPHGAASLSLRLSTGLALSGLQGELRFLEPGLMITALKPAGPAAGMHLSWSPTSSGAKFVLFAEHGAPIPASTPQPVPVLDVEVGPAPIRANIPWPANGFDLEAVALLGADVNGVEVPPCPTLIAIGAVAHLCFDRPCDFDGNGVADVRDLVRMVHCVNGDGPCPDGAATSFDCDGDSRFDLADVLCCAMSLLRGPGCLDCPIDSTRDGSGVHARFGTPIPTSSGLDVPLHLEGEGFLGAARMTFRFPADRFTFAGATLHDAAWLELHQGGDGKAEVGLIRIGPTITLQTSIGMDMMLHLALKPGATLGGDIAIASGAFSANDGVLLRVDLGASPRSLDGHAELAVGAIRPNPSAASFRISLELTAPAKLDVAVHDVAGRRVATLLRGDQPAGKSELVWNGRTEDGAALRGGVYFLRAAVNGRATVRKLVLLAPASR